MKTKENSKIHIVGAGIAGMTAAINLSKFGKSVIIHERKIISFEVKESPRYRTEYFGKWQGVIRPLLEWDTTKLDD